MRTRNHGVWLAVAVVVLSALLGGLYGSRVEATVAGDSEVQQAIRRFTKVYAIIEQQYADPVDPQRVIFDGAIPGMLRSLDPHSHFLNSRAYSLLREEQRGHYYGVGMQVAPRDGRTIVLAPFVGSPAYEAGLRPGDIIFRVDGTATENLTTSEVADLLKGPKGTVVRVEVLREGHDQPLEFTITRAEIPRYSVEFYFEIRPRVGYIRLTSFNENTHAELAAALDDLNPDRLEGLLLDLRGNPGGLLAEGVAVADMFLEKNQLIVSHRGRAQRPRSYYARHGNRGRDFPMVILLDRLSASAAEIVAGALQDHDRALIVGENSFGKGLVQTVYPLSHNTGLALTTARYYTPSGRLIQRDFTSLTLYEYYTGQNSDENQRQEIYTTDSGRTVYGGGGITPDVEVPTPELNDFQETLVNKVIIYPWEVGIGDFAKRYIANHPNITEDFQLDESVLNEFRRYLTERNVRFTEIDIQENRDWLQWRIKKEISISAFGLDQGRRVASLGDPQVLRAIELLPQAKALRENARRVIVRQRQRQNQN
ncbi:S41 family peptidase [Acidobacteriia bacterium AH_259_A11_L15]|nr:S41 family peptidase [Acidobacteriia bacterium AH_259_A11_L15]